MATIKAYTDYPQSKVLSKILSDESADMSWASNGLGKPFARTIPIKGYPEELCGCWSLAALLSVLPHIQEFYPTLEKNNNGYVCRYKGSGIWANGTNSVDACVAMIIKLHELKML